MVELGVYNGIPHLLIPVVTDPKKAAGSLQWALSEMMRRYKAMSDAGVRDLESYNSIVEAEGEGQKIPQIVVIIDELADLMMVAAKEVEESICRLAQMGRAAGIHLIIATQRPSADVITGLMKANIPSRIAFAVASAMESRIILDTPGAEKLVGKGDMLFAPIGAGKPLRVQGCFVSDSEVEAVATFVKENFNNSYDKEIMEEILKSDYDGVICFADVWALEFLTYAKREIEVVSFDSIRSNFFIPCAFASVGTSKEEFCDEIVKMLFEAMNGNKKTMHVVLKTEILE